MFIPKLGNQKFSTLAELLQEQDNFNFNVSQSSMFQLNTNTYAFMYIVFASTNDLFFFKIL